MSQVNLQAIRSNLRNNPRLRIGLWIIAGIVWLYLLLSLRDEVDAITSEYRALAVKTARAESIARQSEWIARAAPAKALAFTAENRLWQESSLGLAQAAVQDWLNQAVQQAGVVKPVLTVAAQEEVRADTSDASNANKPAKPAPEADMWKVNARLGFDFSPKSFYNIMERISGSEKTFVIESMSVKGTPAHVDLLLVAYFRPSGKAAVAEKSAAVSQP
jgi:hypothetical protein